MATWLDYYIDGACDGLNKRMPKVSCTSDCEAMRLIALASVIPEAGNNDRPGSMELRVLMGAILPWLFSPQDVHAESSDFPPLYSPVAYQLSADLLESLVQGDPPATELVSPFLDSHNLYLDLPGRGLPITDRQSLRALFIQPTVRPGQWVFVGILTHGRSNQMSGRHVWTAGADGVVLDSRGGNEEMLPNDSVAAVVWRLVQLAVLYAHSKEDDGQDELPQLLPAADDRVISGMKPKKRQAKRKRTTIFVVRRLERRPSSSLPRGLGNSRWTLDHVVDVAGHFRWQPHGKGNKLRRLRWIDGYQRGKGEPRHIITRPG